MLSSGPISLALGTTTPVTDPAQKSGGPASVAAQIQNSSVFVLSVLAAGEVFTLQPFTAQTIPNTATDLAITPTQNPSGLPAPLVVTVIWLLAGESPPMDDGPLTAAALAAVFAAPAQVELGVFTQVWNGAPQNQIVPTQPFYRALTCVVTNNSDATITLSVIGNVTVFNYLPAVTIAPNAQKQFTVPLWAVIESNGLIVAISSAGGTHGTATVYVIAELDTAAVVVGNPSVNNNGGTAPLIVTPALYATPLDEPDVLIAVTGTAKQLTPSLAPFLGLVVEPLAGNAGQGPNTLRIGSSAVSIAVPGRGIQLAPGQPAVVPAANLNNLWINGLANDGVSLFGL